MHAMMNCQKKTRSISTSCPGLDPPNRGVSDIEDIMKFEVDEPGQRLRGRELLLLPSLEMLGTKKSIGS